MCAPGRAFLSRERLPNGADGFAGFEFLRRDTDGEYVVLTRWETQEHFWEWVRSNRFQRAHRRSQNELATGPELRTYVEHHLRNVFRKLGVRRRAELARVMVGR
jgi:heme-degrading monooxygenase HmoA